MNIKKPISFRCDLTITHDARGFLLASKGLAGRDCRYDLSGSEAAGVRGAKYRQLVQDGVFLPFPMNSKQGGTCLRVLLNKKLSRIEQEEIVDHVAWKLLIHDGQFALIGGGYDYLNGQRDEDESVSFLEVPPGDYRVDVYTCFGGVNGPHLYEEMRDPQEVPLPAGAWFRQTRPGEELPAWLRMQCYEQPECDPGHEDEYDDDVFDYDKVDEELEALVDFIVQLTPLVNAEPLPASPPDLEDGFFPSRVNPQMPKRCPRGLLTLDSDD